MKANEVMKMLDTMADPSRAEKSQSFFKTGTGEYGEGDEFIGVSVPNQRRVAKQFVALDLSEVQHLLNSSVHEHRLTALIILTYQFAKADEREQKSIYDFYILNARNGNVNNWDLVDTSAHKIVGVYIFKRDRSILKQLYNANDLWLNRIAVVSTFYFIAKDDFDDSIAIAIILLKHKHDLIHKAVGWMLREIGKRNEEVLISFLNLHAREMPRTMLRYSIERLPKEQRLYFMGL